MRRQDVAESAGQARTACPARSVRNPERAKGPAQRAAELARGAGAGPAPTGPARSPAAGEMKLPRCQANETCAAARQTKPVPLPGKRNPHRCQTNETWPLSGEMKLPAAWRRNPLRPACAAGQPASGREPAQSLTGLICQISSAYSWMVRSEEKYPILAIFSAARRCHSSGLR